MEYRITNEDLMTVSEWIAADHLDVNFRGYAHLDENGDVVLPEED